MGSRYELKYLDVNTAIFTSEGIEILDKAIKDAFDKLPEGYTIKDWKITKNTERSAAAEQINFDRIYLLLEKEETEYIQ